MGFFTEQPTHTANNKQRHKAKAMYLLFIAASSFS